MPIYGQKQSPIDSEKWKSTGFQLPFGGGTIEMEKEREGYSRYALDML